MHYRPEPIVLSDEKGYRVEGVLDSDGVILGCRRGEGHIHLPDAVVEAGFDRFPRRRFRQLAFAALMVYHEQCRNVPAAFALRTLQGTPGEAVS